MFGRFVSVKDLAFGAYRRSYVPLYWMFGDALPRVRHPHVIEIETTNVCNMACPHCHRHVMKRSEGFMSDEHYYKFIDEIERYPQCTLRFVGLGEPALHPNIKEYIQRLSRTNIKVEVTTNGHLFERMTPEEICNSSIKILGISIDGIDERGYQRLRPGGNYEDLKRRIAEFHEYRVKHGRKGPVVKIRHVLMPKTTDEAVEQYKQTWEPFADQITFNTYNPLKVERSSEELKRCYELFFLARLRWDGYISLCGYQFLFTKQEFLGSVGEKTLSEIWQSPRLQEMRGIHRRKAFDEASFCKKCFNTQCSEKIFANRRNFNMIRNPVAQAINRVVNII